LFIYYRGENVLAERVSILVATFGYVLTGDKTPREAPWFWHLPNSRSIQKRLPEGSLLKAGKSGIRPPKSNCQFDPDFSN
jgi:hypothetical protein